MKIHHVVQMQRWDLPKRGSSRKKENEKVALRGNVKASGSTSSVGLVGVAIRKLVGSQQIDQQEEQHLEILQP
jgi:hypothetical protein